MTEEYDLIHERVDDIPLLIGLAQLRHNLTQTGEQMSGLHAGQPSRKTTRPTGVRLLKAFARGEVTLTRIQMGKQYSWHITPLANLQKQILTYLKLSPSLYKRLIENSS